MEQKIFTSAFDKLLKQRNFFVLISVLLLIGNLLLSITLAQRDTTVVMVPALENQMSVSNKHVSKSYLEGMSNMFLSYLLDLSPSTISYKSQQVLKYTTSKGIQNIENYFKEQSEKLKKFKISTFFTPKDLDINENTLEVKAKGILTSYFGSQGSEHKEVEFLLTFAYKGGSLRLDKFLPVNVQKVTK